MKTCEYLVNTPFEVQKRIGILLEDNKILDPNLVWRGDFERDGFLSCKEKADRQIPNNFKELLTYCEDPIDLLADSYGLYLFLQKVGVDKTLGGHQFIKELGKDGLSLLAMAEIPWLSDKNTIDVEVGVALMSSGEATNLDLEKSYDHMFALNVYQKFGDLISYGPYWITMDDFEDIKDLDFNDLKIKDFKSELAKALVDHAKTSWVGPGDIFFLKSSKKNVTAKPGDKIEIKIPEMITLTNILGTPITERPWEKL